MAIDTENKRRSVSGYTCTAVFPVADGTIDTYDREMVAWLYSGIAAAAPGGLTILDFERAVLRGSSRGVMRGV